jgi:hypothetical protein
MRETFISPTTYPEMLLQLLFNQVVTALFARHWEVPPRLTLDVHTSGTAHELKARLIMTEEALRCCS